MIEEERRVHTEEFRYLFQKANFKIGKYMLLLDYLVWTMFKVEDGQEISKQKRQIVIMMDTLIAKLMLTKEERRDYQ